MKSFQHIQRADWEKQVRTELKTPEAFAALFKHWGALEIGPYYSKEDLPSGILPFSHQFAGGSKVTEDARFWYNLTSITEETDNKANARALKDLMSGADGLHFITTKNSRPDKLLQDIQPQYVFLSFAVEDPASADTIRAYFDEHRFDKHEVSGCILSDFPSNSENFSHCYKLFEHWPAFRTLHVNTSLDARQPVKACTAAMVHTNHILETLSPISDPTIIAKNLFFTCELGRDYFRNIIGLRAMRIVIYKMLRAWGAEIDPEELFIIGESNAWQGDQYSEEVNMIQSVTAGMAGVLGGCQALNIRPVDPRNETQRRIARNVSIMLREESYFNKTRDAISGAFYIENLTDQLARHAWRQFQSRN